jgi:hypothetical protein
MCIIAVLHYVLTSTHYLSPDFIIATRTYQIRERGRRSAACRITQAFNMHMSYLEHKLCT